MSGGLYRLMVRVKPLAKVQASYSVKFLIKKSYIK